MAEKKHVFEHGEVLLHPPPLLSREITLFLSLPWLYPSCRLVNFLDEAGHEVSGQWTMVGAVEPPCRAPSLPQALDLQIPPIVLLFHPFNPHFSPMNMVALCSG